MTDTSNSTGEINSSLKNGIALSRYAAGALLGSLIGVCVGMALGLQGWLGVVTLVGVILVCAVYGKNRLLLLLALFFMTYFAGMGYSRNKIASFCNSISATTHSAELLSLADRARVEFRSGPVIDRPGISYGRAADSFSMGDYGCRIEFDDKHVISSRIYSH